MRFWKCIGTLGVVYMEFGNCMGTYGAIRVVCIMFGKCMGTLGVIGVVYVRFGNCMGALGGHRGRLREVWEVYGDPRGS